LAYLPLCLVQFTTAVAVSMHHFVMNESYLVRNIDVTRSQVYLLACSHCCLAVGVIFFSLLFHGRLSITNYTSCDVIVVVAHIIARAC
jgi:hypothetical protein